MKFAMHDQRTKDALTGCHPGTWAVHGFFFYDRGSRSVQTSISGLFCEILRGILKQHKQLVRYVLPIYRDKVKHTSHIPKVGPSRNAGDEEQWTCQDLREAFSAICSQSNTPANILLFIDALDEHSEPGSKGSVAHNDLLDVLDDITAAGNGPKTVNLKLCLASRPEPAFLDRLQRHPGSVVHHLTWKDIDIYITERFRKQLSDTTREIKSSSIETIKKRLLRSANGVFIWVRLAMNELVRAFQHGEGGEVLESISNELPPDLDAMYKLSIQHALDELQGVSERTKQRHLLEMHIMFTIALSASTCESGTY